MMCPLSSTRSLSARADFKGRQKALHIMPPSQKLLGSQEHTMHEADTANIESDITDAYTEQGGKQELLMAQ